MLLKSVSESKVIEIIGHRGASGSAPENTLSSFSKAIEFGVKQVEFDVCLTQDGVPVIFHDERIGRCSNGRGKLSELTLTELLFYDYGSWFDKKFKGESLLTLEALLDFLADSDMKIQLELKVHKNISAKKLVTNTLHVISDMNFQTSRITFSSFDRGALRQVLRSGTEIQIAVLFDKPEKDWKEWVEECKADFIHFNCSLVNKDFFVELKNSGCGLRSYTVNDMKTAQQLYNNGVRGFFTDYPDRIDSNLLVEKYQQE